MMSIYSLVCTELVEESKFGLIKVVGLTRQIYLSFSKNLKGTEQLPTNWD